MRIGTFYFSTADGPDRQRIVLPNGGDAFIRIVESDGDLSDALDDAAPQEDESLMNRHKLDPA